MTTHASTAQRLYLMQVAFMPIYQIPIVCYLVQTSDGKNILIDSGLPETLPADFPVIVPAQNVVEQLAGMGVQPDAVDIVVSTHYDVDHAGCHGAFDKAQYVVQRLHHTDA